MIYSLLFATSYNISVLFTLISILSLTKDSFTPKFDLYSSKSKIYLVLFMTSCQYNTQSISNWFSF